LATNVEYQFSGRKLAVFTWHGCDIESSGKNAVEYIGYETPKQSEINIHFALNNLRKEAKEQDEIGPRVMIVGPTDVGKTSLAKTLVSYSTRTYTNTLLCEIDPTGVQKIY
jgi:polyribonucleotide 5'-hydroxyl-kinase